MRTGKRADYEAVAQASAAVRNGELEYARVLLATVDDPLMASVELVGVLLIAIGRAERAAAGKDNPNA